MAELDDIAKEFLVESYENLDRLDQDFVDLEENPSDLDKLASIFRTIHTIKGTCGFLGFSKLESITHVGENLLGKLRDGELSLNDAMTTVLLKLVDAVREILGSLENSGEEGDADYSGLTQDLSAFLEDAPLQSTQATADTLMQEEAQAPEPEGAAEAPDPVQAEPAKEEKTTASPTSSVADASIRVDVNLLDGLMNLVGELVLTRNQVLQHGSGIRNEALHKTLGQLNHITSELQEQVMKTRMQPVSSVWNKFPRVVRDLSRQVGKQIRLEMEGKETELDKSLLEAIKDPLTHIIRNSVDHGIEMPQERTQAGKNAEGVLRLRAFQEGGLMVIEIMDDGGGINPEKTKAKALEKGLITQEQARTMGEREAQTLIFKAGFSTAASVTNISGRGVGMDVVRTNIEKIGGSVEIQSQVGQGTTLTLKIPLTLAIIPALCVHAGGHRFAIPQSALQEVVRIDRNNEEDKIEDIYGAPVYRLRGEILPLVHLSRELDLSDEALDQNEANIVVLHTENRSFGLVVDTIADSQEIVVKPLGRQLEGLDLFAGATILGDGGVSLILDITGLASRAHVQGDDHQELTQTETHEEAAEKRALLLFRVRDDGRMVLPLDQILRVDEIKSETLEHVGGRIMLQHQGAIIPIIRVFDHLPERREYLRSEEESRETTQVVIFTHQGKRAGLIMGTVLDSVDASFNEKGPPTRDGIMGTLMVNERVTEILDIEQVVAMVGANYITGPAA